MSNFDEQLAEVPSLQHSNEGARSRFETVDDVLSIPNLAACYQRSDFPKELTIVLRSEFRVNKATDQETAPEDRECRFRPRVTTRLLNAVIQCNQSAHGDARIAIQ